jgi:hypothetical protein
MDGPRRTWDALLSSLTTARVPLNPDHTWHQWWPLSKFYSLLCYRSYFVGHRDIERLGNFVTPLQTAGTILNFHCSFKNPSYIQEEVKKWHWIGSDWKGARKWIHITLCSSNRALLAEKKIFIKKAEKKKLQLDFTMDASKFNWESPHLFLTTDYWAAANYIKTSIYNTVFYKRGKMQSWKGTTQNPTSH